MFEKSFITDCEGPLTLNDNAFELCSYFLENGDELFKILSSYDDYLADVVKMDNYKSGNTLKLILPFFVLENIKNDDFIGFSKNNICAINDSKFLLKYLQKSMNTFIVSTSYGQYIEALSNYMDFPFENTYYTKVDMDELVLTDDELLDIARFKDEILNNPTDYEMFDDIFFEKIPKMNIYQKIKDIDVIGGLGKKLAIDDILENSCIDINQILYIGDSITDVEPLNFAKMNGGISISFNGNEYPLKVAEIAIVSSSAITTAVIADIYSNNDKNIVLKFIMEYNSTENISLLFDEYDIDFEIKDRFFKVFNNGSYPIIDIINEKNYDNLLKKSVEMRNTIRGEDIGGLG